MTPEPTVPSPTAARRMPARTALVIGAVVVLAVAVGIVAAMYLLRGGAAPASAAWVPGDALMYFDLHGDLAPSQRAALDSLLDRFEEVPDDLLDGGIVRWIDEQLEESGAEYRYDTDIGSWFDGSVGIAILEVPPITEPPEAPAGVLAVLGVKNAGAAQAFLDRLRADAEERGSAFDSETYEGSTIWSSSSAVVDPMTGGPGGAYALAGDRLLVGADADAVKAALDANAGRRDRLTVRAEFQALLARMPAERVLTIAVDGAAMFEAQRRQMDELMPGMGDLFGAFRYAAVYTVGAGWFEQDRMIFEGVSERPEMEATVANEARGLADHVPADAMLFADGNNVGETLAEMVTAIKRALPSAAESPELNAETVEQVEAILGNQLESFVAWADDVALVGGAQGDIPYGGLVIRPTDASEARARLDQLKALAQFAAIDPSLGIAITDGEHAGTAVTTIRIGDATSEGFLPAFAVQWAVSDELVVLGIGEEFVARVLDLDPGQSLGQNERFRAAIGEVGGADNLASAWLDIAAIDDAVEPLMSDLGFEYDSTVRAWVEPFDYLVQVSRLEGDLIVNRSEVVVR